MSAPPKKKFKYDASFLKYGFTTITKNGIIKPQDVLREFRWEVLHHPPYSPDLTPSDFFLFPILKKSSKEPILII